MRETKTSGEGPDNAHQGGVNPVGLIRGRINLRRGGGPKHPWGGGRGTGANAFIWISSSEGGCFITYEEPERRGYL